MNVAVLGGLGMQGRAAVYDLARSDGVTQVICADVGPPRLGDLAEHIDRRRVTFVSLDASSSDALASLLGGEIDVAIDLLPQPLMTTAIQAAIEARVDLVTTNYLYGSADVAERARRAGIRIMPECGLDPGIDLVICGHVARQFDELHLLESYCGGVPRRDACTNPLDYKISWNWDMVLRSQVRDSVMLCEGRRVAIPADRQHHPDHVRRIEVPGVGEMEAIPNGDAVFYTDLLGVTDTIRTTGRYALRWPGWSAFWAPMKALGFLSDEAVPGLECDISPRRFLGRHLEPRLQYAPDESDIIVMVNVFEGVADGRQTRRTTVLTLQRDMATGLFAMALGVGYPVSIVARMLAAGDIQEVGLLSPALHVPYGRFMNELGRRGVTIREDEG